MNATVNKMDPHALHQQQRAVVAGYGFSAQLGPWKKDISQCRILVLSGDQEGEFFDCESNFTDGEMERTLSQPNMTCKQSSMRRRTPANGACSLEPESDQRTKEPEPNYLTSLWVRLQKNIFW